MPEPTMEAVVAALQQSWSIETSDPHDVSNWHAENRSRGQCIVTALVMQDYFGGELLEALVHIDDVHYGYHTWNRIDGEPVDVTRDQFAENEILSEPYVVPRITGDDMRMRVQYELLAERVAAVLAKA